MKQLATWICLALLVLGQQALAAAAEEGSCGRSTLRLSMIPKKDVDRQMIEYAHLSRALSARLDLPVELIRPVSYQSVIEGLISGAIDMAELGPAAYIDAHGRDPDIEAFASLAFNAGHFTPAGESYHSVLLVRADAGFTELAALRGSRVALTDPSSTSGALIPATEFPDRTGLRVDSFFASLRYAGSHDRALDSLLEQRVEAVFVSSSRADEYLRRGLIGQQTLVELWRSEPIHYDPFVFSSGLCEPLRQRIRAAMLGDDPAAAAFIESQRGIGLTPVTHLHYLPIERLARSR